MRIAFYAPMKPPDHPSPSGDRLMARQIVAVLEGLGHEVAVASRLVSRTTGPDPDRLRRLLSEASDEADRLSATAPPPSLWITYHLYHKAPDLIGPVMARRWGIPYLVIEASYTPSRDTGPWAEWQVPVRGALDGAAAILTMTGRDRDGLIAAGFGDRLVDFPPFLLNLPGTLAGTRGDGATVRLLTVAMMRPGPKLASYRLLSQAVRQLPPDRFAIDIVGDGPCRAEVEAMFAQSPLPVRFHGARSADEVTAAMAGADLIVWPGIGEAYGMVYLEAQAAGLPVVAMEQAGVPDAVPVGAGGVLVSGRTDASAPRAFADAVLRLGDDPAARRALGEAGQGFVRARRSGVAAARQLDRVLYRATNAAWKVSRQRHGEGWRRVLAALDGLDARRETIDIWLRDDDAVADTPALRRLRALLEAHGVPALLAVIPSGLEPSLVDLLAQSPVLVPCQHGVTHENRAGDGERKAELIDRSGVEPMLAELARAREALAHGLPGFLPVLVPPWNRIDPAVRARLGEAGFLGLSVFGHDIPEPEHITLRNTHVDLVDWRGGRVGKGSGRVAEEFLAELDRALSPGGDARLGILMHHLAHDEEAWRSLEDMLAAVRHHPAVRWPHPREVFGLS